MVCEMSKSGTMESNVYGHESERKLEPPPPTSTGQSLASNQISADQYRRAARKLIRLANSILQCTELAETCNDLVLPVTLQQRQNSIKELAIAAQKLRERSRP